MEAEARWSVAVAGADSAENGEGATRRGVWADPKEPLMETPKFAGEEDACSEFGCQYDVAVYGASKFAEQPLFGVQNADGEYEYESFERMLQRVEALACALERKLALNEGDRIGIMAKNCPEWMITSLACNKLGVVIVSLYDSLDAETLQYIINHAELTAVFASAENATKLKKNLAKCPSVKSTVLFPPKARGSDAADEGSKEGEYMFAKLEEEFEGQKTDGSVAMWSVEKKRANMAQLMYTSGTTSKPKGTLISNRAILAEIAGLTTYAEVTGINVGPGDISFSFLPLAHIFEQAIELSYMSVGCAIAYSCGDTRKLTDDLSKCQPTILPAVPRVLTRFESVIQSKVAAANAVSRMVFKLAYAQQAAWINSGGFRNRSALLDRLVFDPIKAQLFPRLRLIMSGSAPLPRATADYLRVVLNSLVVEGYGATETCAAIATTHPMETSAEGLILLPIAEAKLRDVADMGYTSRDEPRPRGELLIRSGALFEEYLHDEKETESAITSDGYFCTGDVAQWNADGTFSIIDRKKNMFKLAQGEYVAAEKVEEVYARARGVTQIWVHGSSDRYALVAVVVLSKSRQREYDEAENEEEAMKKLIAEFDALAKEFNLPGYERLKRVHIESEVDDDGLGFTIENECMTPSFKIKRPVMKKRYADEIEKMYKVIEG